MIHQFILAAPKPGMSTEEFQNYWVDVHAVKYASQIPQIRRYLVDTRIPFDLDLGEPVLPHQGIAEIWLENEEEQLASLRSPEFLDGARADEPNWAAFWQTIVIDTTAHQIVPRRAEEFGGAAPSREDDLGGVKLTVLLRRQAGLALPAFRQQALGSYAHAVSELPGLRRYLQAHTRDNAYVFGEPAFDAVEQLWFDDLDAVRAALTSAQYTERVFGERAGLVDSRYLFSLLAEEHWIIGPAYR